MKQLALLGAWSLVVHWTSTHRGTILDNIPLEGGGLIICPTCSLCMELHKLWISWSKSISYKTHGFT